MKFSAHCCFDELAKPASVAVIMRTKDRPVLLSRAIASVCNQKFKAWHLYVVNDSGSVETVDHAVKPYRLALGDRITVIHNPTSAGMEAASNLAARRVTAKYAVIHDDDDSWHQNFLQETVAFLEHPQNAGCGGVVAWSKRVEEEIMDDDTVKLRHETDFNIHLQEIDLFEMLRGNTFPPISFLFRAELFQKIGFFNEKLPVLGDWEFNIRVLAVSDIGLVKQSLAYYHHRPQTRNQYGNSVIAGVSQHLEFNLLYRNQLLRTSLSEYPELAGVLMAVSMAHRRLRDNVDGVHYKLDRSWENIDGVHFKLDHERRRLDQAHQKLDHAQRRFDHIQWQLDELTRHLQRPHFFKRLERSIRKHRKKLWQFFTKKEV